MSCHNALGSNNWTVRCGSYSHLQQVAVTAGSNQSPPTSQSIMRVLRPVQKGNLVMQEIFAGLGAISSRWRTTGAALEPIELYAEPHRKEGARPSHDLSKGGVQEKLMQDLQSPAGPNVGWIASPCTSYCDWQLKNGGTRTWEAPQGTGHGPR